MQNGNYEARLFYNNSFITEAAIAFTRNAGPGAIYTPLSDRSITQNFSSNFTLDFGKVIYPLSGLEEGTDWIGIYHKEDVPTRENLLVWGYLTKIDYFNSKANMETLDHKELDVGEYKLVSTKY